MVGRRDPRRTPGHPTVALFVALTVFVLLVVFMLVGTSLLKFFGVTLNSFRIAGGLLLGIFEIATYEEGEVTLNEPSLILNTLRKDPTNNQDEGLRRLYLRLSGTVEQLERSVLSKIPSLLESSQLQARRFTVTPSMPGSPAS